MTIAGRVFNFVYPPLADIQHSTWIHDQESKVLFTADGFGNYHDLDDAAKTTAEMDDISTIENLREFHRSALLWLQYVHPPTLVDGLTSLFERYDVNWIAPIHGNPIAAGDLEEYLARLEQAITDIN
jgi:flavorubredoxin